MPPPLTSFHRSLSIYIAAQPNVEVAELLPRDGLTCTVSIATASTDSAYLGEIAKLRLQLDVTVCDCGRGTCLLRTQIRKTLTAASCARARLHLTEHRGRRTRNPRASPTPPACSTAARSPGPVCYRARTHTNTRDSEFDIQLQIPLSIHSRQIATQPPAGAIAISSLCNPVPAAVIGGSHSQPAPRGACPPIARTHARS